MDNILIITSDHDIPVAEGMAAQLDSCRTYFFDPTLVDPIAASKLPRTELLTWDAGPSYPEMEARAHALAHTLERELATALPDWPADVALDGFQHLNLYYFFMAHQWYSGLWQAILPRLAGCKVHVALCDAVPNFYWPSFLPGLLLLQLLRTHGIEFAAVNYGARADDSDVMMNLFDGNPEGQRWDVLTHLPTCFYDHPYISDELAAAGKRSINVEPKYWGVPLHSTSQVKLARLQRGELERRGMAPLAALEGQLETGLERALAPWIASAGYRARHVRQLCNLYLSQLASLHLLERYFHAGRPARMLLSDHDGGFHGPLLAYAQRHQIPVCLLPHSKVGNDCDFSYGNLTSLTHPLQGAPLVNARGRRLLHFTLSYPEQYAASSAVPAPLRRISLLLNGLSLNGVQCTDWRSYLDGIRAIDAWCRQRGLQLAIRCRPGQGLLELLEQAIGAPRAATAATLAQPLANFVQEAELCLMYDAPTSAAIEFLRQGVPILNPVPAPLSKSERLWTDSELVPRADVAATLARLDGFFDDPDMLHEFRRSQFADYVARSAQSYALRRFI